MNIGVITNRSIAITWDPPDQGIYDEYRLTVTGQGISPARTQTLDKTVTSHVISSLDPGIIYTIKLLARSAGVDSDVVTQTATTSRLYNLVFYLTLP